MYIPESFAETDADVLHGIIRDHNFAILVTIAEGVPFATHLPFLLDAERGPRGTLVAHMARANPQWRSFADGAEALVVFQGPHAYVSPSWYASRDKVVPTWNYVAVHAYGTPRVIEDEAQVRDILARLVGQQERAFETPWRMDGQPADFLAAMVRGIVAFEIPIARLEGKRKLSQNRPAADHDGAARALADSDDAMASAVAALMTAGRQS